ncbi:chemotaxis protein CheA [Hydrogenivirga sp. 128-5-R1-1]|uniref:chemotaxis protein CheA n=1 Tax=Hydrogenivirga sp. 128-5-R1-1 TaxID=392423 RepID=UPI00015F1911|nr:chemotaxis protein CheA [Hydrogenivirga sp. 128-5-R1-1]EDP75518.1 Chemotaxis protein histidine kinase and related kinase [Hydrogenivirga sp. 128-5-R1-1]
MKFLIKFRLGKSVFERAIDPRFYIEDLKELGETEVKIIRENIPAPDEEPTDEHVFEADVILETDRTKEEVLELLEFILEDGVEVEVLEGEESAEKKEETKKEEGEIPQALLENYKLETEEILSRLRGTLEELAENPGSVELINEVFRSFHTLKGNTGLIISYREEPNLKYIHEITHKAETVLQKARDSGIGLTDRQVEILQELVDRLDDLFLAFSEGKEEDAEDVFELLEELGSSTEKKEELKQGEGLPADVSALLNVASQYIPVYRELCSKEELNEEEEDFFRRSLLTLHKLTKELGFEELNKKIKELQNAFGNVDFKEFCQNLEELANDLQKLVEEKSKEVKKEEKREDKKSFDASKYVTRTSYLKIEESMVRDLMDIVGELSVFKEWIYLFASKLQRTYGVPEAAKELKDNIHRFRSLMDSLQRTVLEMRMIPVSTLFERFPKLVRDLSRTLGKKVKLEIEGGDTKLDKVIVEKIAEPMIHLIRNAIDHGIETPEEREALGKPIEGHIRIRAFQEGGNVVIEVSDDGRGIDVEKVRQKAIEKGLYTEEELSHMSEEEILQIIFQPGFSTKEQATELSGRGVGMDVVASTIREFGGEVSLQTQKAMGTTVKLLLPLTLAIRKILLVRIGDVTFGVPAEDVGEVLKIGRKDIKSLKGLKVVYHRDKVLELDFVNERLGIQSTANGTVTLLIDNALTRGVVVDEVLSTIDTVVKPLPSSLVTSEDISGITILGDGSIVYILEVLK